MFALSLLLFSLTFFKAPEVRAVAIRKGDDHSFAFEKIFTGPLSLRENGRSPLAISLEHKLSLLARSTRPDVEGQEKVFCIGINGSEETVVVKEGGDVFLDWTKGESGAVETVSFSKNGVRATAEVLDNRSLLLKTDDLELLLKADASSLDAHPDSEGLASLSLAKWWGVDRLFNQYGGAEYGHLGQKQMLEIGEGKEISFLFVAAGDFLSFSEGKWKVLETLDGSAKDAPLAHVRAMGERGLEIEAWDREGFLLLDKVIQAEPQGSFRVQPEQLFTEVRMRSSTQVSCLLEKRRMILKEGDWLFKTNTGWSKLKTLNEIEAFLNHELVGELFVVDKVDPSGVLNGHYFDEKRVHSQPIALRFKQQPNQNRMARAIRRGLKSKL